MQLFISATLIYSHKLITWKIGAFSLGRSGDMTTSCLRYTKCYIVSIICIVRINFSTLQVALMNTPLSGCLTRWQFNKQAVVWRRPLADKIPIFVTPPIIHMQQSSCNIRPNKERICVRWWTSFRPQFVRCSFASKWHILFLRSFFLYFLLWNDFFSYSM